MLAWTIATSAAHGPLAQALRHTAEGYRRRARAAIRGDPRGDPARPTLVCLLGATTVIAYTALIFQPIVVLWQGLAMPGQGVKAGGLGETEGGEQNPWCGIQRQGLPQKRARRAVDPHNAPHPSARTLPSTCRPDSALCCSFSAVPDAPARRRPKPEARPPMSSLDEELSQAEAPPKAMTRPWGGRASRAEAAEFAEHLAGLTRSGLPLPSGLRALGSELPSRRLGRDMTEMADRLERGDALDSAVVGVAGRFPPQLRGLLIAGAHAGKLGDVLGQYARYANLGAALRRRFWAAVGYPLFLVVAVTGLYIFVCLWIVDSFRFILEDFKMEVPPITQALFWMAEATRTRGPSIRGDLRGARG